MENVARGETFLNGTFEDQLRWQDGFNDNDSWLCVLPLPEKDLKSTIFNLIDLAFNSRTSGVSLQTGSRIFFMLVSSPKK